MYRSGDRGLATASADLEGEVTPKAPGRASRPQALTASAVLDARIPLAWLRRAACLPGRSLHVGIALWTLVGPKRPLIAPLPNVAVTDFGLDRNAKYRALAWLEGAGLISVERKLGQPPIICILEAEAET